MDKCSVDDDRAEGTWGAYNFEEAPAAIPVKLDDSVVPFSLLLQQKTIRRTTPYIVLDTQTKSSTSDTKHRQIFVTYRFLYPNGEVNGSGTKA